MHNDMEWSCNVSRYGIGHFRHCATIVGTVRFFRKFDFLGTAARQRGYLLRLRIINTPGDILLRCGDRCD